MKITAIALFYILLATAPVSESVKLPDVDKVASDVDGGFVTDSINVKLAPANDNDAIHGFVQKTMAITGCKDGKRMIRPVSGPLEDKHRAASLHLWYQFKCQETANPGKGPLEAIKKLAALSDIENTQKYGLDIVEVDYVTQVTGFSVSDDVTEQQLRGSLHTGRSLVQSSDPKVDEQLHYDTISLQDGWNAMTTSAWSNLKNVVVQVLDTGWDTNNQDLGSNAWLNLGEICNNGIDDDGNGFIDDCNGFNHGDNTGTDLLGDGSHGSHCSGTIAADTNNGRGVAGVAGGQGAGLGASIMTSVAFGATSTRGFADALIYGADNGAHISSNSWGYVNPGTYNQPVLDAIDYAEQAGVLVVFAAGNDNSNDPYYPGYYSKTIAVAATNNAGTAAPFSNYGDWVDIAAPGVSVLSTVIGTGIGESGYARYSGTSMACPHVAGILALGKAANLDANAATIKNCLYTTADNIDGANNGSVKQGQLGAGMANTAAFLECLAPASPPTPTPPSAEPSAAPFPAPSAAPSPAPLEPVVEPACSSYNKKNTCGWQAPRCFWGTKNDCSPTNKGNNGKCCTL